MEGSRQRRRRSEPLQSAERFASAWSFILQASSSGPPDEILIILASLALVGQIILILFLFPSETHANFLNEAKPK